MKRFLCLAVVLFIAAAPLICQEPPDYSDHFNQGMFDAYLQRAGEESSRQAWQELADYGVQAVVSDWERRFLALILDPAEFARQRELLRRNLAQEAEERFADWLVRGFFAEVGDQTLAALLEEAGRRGRQYLFLSDEAGNLLYDEAGDPLVRGTRDGEADSYARDREAWGSAMRDRMGALLVSWEQTATAGLDELLAVVPPERQPDLERQWAVRLADARQSRQRELDKIFLLEQSRFDRWRLQDRYSLRLQSEGQTAAAVAAQLIQMTQAEVDSGLAALLHGLNTEVGEVNVEGTPIDGEQWQEQFRSELQKGLTLWDRAEEEFFLRRIEWERKAGYDLAEGQEAWLQAFETLQSRRGQWLNEFRQSLDQGRLVWESRSLELDQAVQKAIAELDSNLEAQRASLAGRAENLVAMLGQSLQMMDTARENWEYWLGGGEAVPMNVWDMRLYYLQSFLDRRTDTVLIGVTGGEAAPSSQAGSRRAAELAQPFLTDFCFASARDSVGPDGVGFLPGILDDWERRLDEFIAARGLAFSDGEEEGGFRAYFTSLLEELRGYQQEEKPEQALYWMEEIYTAYERFATDAHRELASTYGLVVFGDPLGSLDDPGISGMIGALEDGSWENLFLDDYQVELLKARAVRGYWEKELEIAQAVYDYSVDTSSGRPTQAETRVFYERSLREYEAALVRYNGAVDSLESVNTALAGNQQQLAALMDRLNELKADLLEAEQVYQDYYLAYRLDSPQYQQEEFRRYYERLLDLQGLSPTEAHNQESLAVRLADYRAAARSYEAEADLALVSKELTRLIDGNYDLEDATPTHSLETLRKIFADRAAWQVSLAAWQSASVFLASLREGGLHLSSSDAAFQELEDLYLGFQSAAEQEESDKNLFLARVRSIVDPLLEAARGELETRMDAIRLLSTGSFSSWLSGLSPTDYTGRSLDQVAAGLRREGELAGKTALIQRLQVEIGALHWLRDQMAAYRTAHGTLEGYAPAGPEDWGLTDRFTQGGAGFGSERVLAFVAWSGWLEALPADQKAAGLEQALQRLQGVRTVLEGLDGTLAENRDRLRQSLSEYDSLFVRDGVDYTRLFLDGSRGGQERLQQAALLIGQYSGRAPCLRAEVRREQLAVLRGWLVDRGLASDTPAEGLVLRDPLVLWEGSAFGSFRQMREFLVELEIGLSQTTGEMDLPDYVMQGVQQWRSALTRFFLRQAVSSGWNDLPVQAGDAEAGLEMLYTELVRYGETLERIYQGAEPDSVGVRLGLLLGLLESEANGFVGPSEVAFVREQFVSTVALEVAAAAMAMTDGVIDFSQAAFAHSVWAQYLDSLNLDGTQAQAGLLEQYRQQILQEAQARVREAEALADLEGTAWGSQGEKLRAMALVSRLKGLPLAAYVERVRSEADVPGIEALYLLDRELEQSEGDLPWDVERADAAALAVIYGGDEAAWRMDRGPYVEDIVRSLLESGGIWGDFGAWQQPANLLGELDWGTLDLRTGKLAVRLLAEAQEASPVADPELLASFFAANGVDEEPLQSALAGALSSFRAGSSRAEVLHSAFSLEGLTHSYDGAWAGLALAELSAKLFDYLVNVGAEVSFADVLAMGRLDISVSNQAASWVQEFESAESREALLSAFFADPTLPAASNLAERLLNYRYRFAEDLSRALSGAGALEDFVLGWRQSNLWDLDAAIVGAFDGFLQQAFTVSPQQGSELLVSDVRRELAARWLRGVSGSGDMAAAFREAPGQALYAKSYALAAAEILSKELGRSDYRGALSWLFQTLGCDAPLDVDWASYFTADAGARVRLLYEGDDVALSFYLKSLAAAGELESELIDRYAAKAGIVESLERFRSILEAENGYLPGIDPDPLTYLREEGYLGPQAGLAESVAYLQALSGSPWDDEYFTPAQPTAEQAAQGYALSRESLVTCWIGAEDRGAALAVLQWLEGPLQDHISGLQESHLRQTSQAGVDGLYAAAWDDVHTREHFRGFLKGDGFLLENSSTWDSNERDYEQPVRESKLVADRSGSLVSAEQDVLNWQLESYNDLLSENSFLASALLAYEQEEGDATFTAARERFFAGYSDLEGPAPQPFTVGVEVSGAWREAASALQSARNEIAHLRETLTSYGKVVSDFLDNVPFDDISRPIRSEIADIRSRIADTEAQWERLINGPGGFRDLERDYAERYGEVRARLSELGEAKQEHKTAKAIHEYASSGYLANAVPASQSVTGPEDLQAEMEALQESIDAVDPDARLLYVHDRLRNASAAADALQAIFEDPDTQQTLLQRDAAYAEYRRSYEEYYRSELVLHKIEKVLSSEGQEQTVAVRDARRAYEQALQEFAGLSLEGERQTFVDDLLQKIQDPSDTNDRFTNLIGRIAIQYDEAGNASIGFSATGDVEASRADFERYFGAAGQPFEEIAYLQEVMRFSEKLDANAITRDTIQQWVKAMAFEELQIRTAGAPEYIVVTGGGRNGDSNWSYFNPAVQSAMEEILKGAYLHSDDDVQKYVDEHDVYRELQTACNATNRSDKDYKLFQMAYLLGLWGGEPRALGDDYLEYVTFHSSAEELDDKVDSFWTWRKRKWRGIRDKARTERDNRETLVKEAWYLLDSGGGDPHAKLALLEQAETRLALLNGNPAASGAPVGIANLKQAILDAFERDPYEHLDQVLALTGIQGPDIGSKLDRLLNPLRIAGVGFAGTAKDTLLLLQTVMEETVRQKENLQNRFLSYLAASSSSEDPGIAVVQGERLREYGELLARFLGDGAVAPEGSDLEAHESLVARIGDAKVGDVQVLATVGAYLGDYYRDSPPVPGAPVPSGYSGNRFERDLHEAYQAFFLDPSSEELRERRWEVLMERYVAMVRAYRLGADFLHAAEAALNNPVFSSREHALRGFEDFAAVFDSLTKTYDGYTFAGAGLALGDVQEGLEEVLAGRSRAYRELRVQEMSLLRTELEEQRLLWDQQMSAILARGQMEWKQAQHQVQARQQQWQKSFQESFLVKKEAWNLQYANFLEQKREWVAGLTAQATRVGNQRILERFGADTREAIARGQDFLISDVAELPDPDALIAQTLGEGLLSGLLGGAGSLGNGIAQWEPVSFGALKLASFQGAESLERIRAFQCRQNEQLSTRMAVLQYGQALEALREARQGLEGQVAEANQEFSESMRRMLLHDGFRQEGVNFVKQAVVGATIWKTLTERHTIAGYRDYEAQLKEVGQLLPEADAGSLEQLGFAGIQGLLSRGMQGLEEEQERVFGEPEDTRYLHQRYGGADVAGQEEDAALGYAAQLAVYERVRGVDTQRIGEEEFERLVEELEDSQGERVVMLGGGEFGAHIGFAPTLKPEPDADYALEEYEKNQRFAGLGEQGRILGLYLQHKLIEAKGYAEANQPFYNKKLWDDRGMDFKAFTIRAVVDIGVTIAAAAFAPVTGGASLAASVALNLVDDAVFTLADIASGMDAGEAFGAFGKKALTSAATAAIGSAASGLDKALGFQGAAEVVSDVGITAGRVAASGYSSAAIEAVDFTKLGTGQWFDRDAFAQATSFQALGASVIASSVGTLVSSSLDTRISGYINNTYGNANTLNNLAGGLTTAGLEYLLTGETRFNVLSFADLSGGRGPSVGLLEMHLGGEEGFFMNLGMEGVAINPHTLYRANQGFEAYRQNERIREAGVEAGFVKAMRTAYSAGFGETTALYEEVLAGRTQLHRDASLSSEALTETINGVREVRLRGEEGKFGDLRLGVVLAHEAFRNGLDDGVQGQQVETLRAAIAHSVVASSLAAVNDNGVLSPEMMREVQMLQEAQRSGDYGQFAEYVAGNYDSSQDFWKLLKDGTLLRDGRSSLYVETANGGEFKLWGMESLSEAEGLARILGTSVENAQALTWSMVANKADALQTEVLSEAVKKRLGLYSIVNAEVNLSEDAFDRIAYNSWKINNELGNFVDFNIVEEELLKKHYETAVLTRRNHGILDPLSEYQFNGAGFVSSVLGYGPAFSLGISFEYSGLWEEGRNRQEIRLETGGGNRPTFTIADVARIHNENLTSTGAPALRVDRYGKTEFVQTYRNSITYGYVPPIGSAANALAILAQYSIGSQNAIENATSMQMPVWEIEGVRFFSVVGKETRKLRREGNSQIFMTGPDFYSLTDMLIDRRVRNYANYLADGRYWWTAVRGWWNGWDW